MDYPKEFPPESRAAVLAAKIRAARDFDRTHLELGNDKEEQLRKYILRQLLVFVQEASKLNKIWPVDKIEKAALEFLRRATIDAVYEKGLGSGRLWISRTSGSLTSEICRQFEKSSEWQQFEDMLLRLAEGEEPRKVTEPRRGYRAEVKAWMKREQVDTLREASQRLNMDVSALKSIMASKGKLRYGPEALNRVLKTIGHKGE
jgi:hypothetical protein